MLTVEKLKAMQPWEIFASGEWIDDWKLFNIWWEGKNIQWVAVRWKGYYDWAIYYHLYSMKEAKKQNDMIDYFYHTAWNILWISTNWDKLTNERTIREIVPCDDEAFRLYRY